MSDMYTHANKLNEMLKEIGMSEAQLNIMLECARVAKFRCRSNTAFANFIQTILRDTRARLETVKGEEYDTFRIVGKVEQKGLELVA